MHRRVAIRGWLIPAAALISAAIALPAAQSGTKADAESVRKAYDAYRSMAQSSPYRSIPWQYLGPTNISGRATDVDVADRGGARRIYVGYATSGVWKTDDKGATWQSIFDDQATSSIGDLAVAPSNPDILWVGTGEANLFRGSMAGVGIYKSVNGGRTFSHSGLTDTHTIPRIIVHPTNPDVVYVAASGHGWTENEMRGVFKTTDGGRTWDKVLYRGPNVGAIDLVMDPSDPNTLYAATWQRTRRKWSDPRVEAGSTESGLWKTTDAGKTWNPINEGLPAAQFRGRLGIDVARSNPNVLYAFLDNYEEGRPARENERDAYGRPISESRIKAAEIYRTDDKGKTWRKVSGSDEFMTGHSGTYGWVFGQIRVDPTDENTIYSLGLGLNVSRDAGKSFTELRGMHVDHHGLWIDPKPPATLYNANDGGFYSSDDSGKTWKFAVSAGGAQFYNVTLDNSTPAWAYGSIQDHGSRRARVDLSTGAPRFVRRSGPTPLAAKAHTRLSIPPIPKSCFRTASTGTSRARTRQKPQPDAAERGKAEVEAAGAGAAVPASRRSGRRSAREMPSCARSGWRRSSHRSINLGRSTPAISSSTDRRIVATRGSGSART